MAFRSVPELLVHVGLPKTGTTAIQRYMYLNRDAYAQRGIYWAETYLDGGVEPDAWAHHIYSSKWGGWADCSQYSATPDEAWQALRNSMRAKGGRHIISSEAFAGLLPWPIGEDALNFMRETAGPARVRLICYVRRQDYLLESHIRQLTKTRELGEGNVFDFDIETYLQDISSFASFAFFSETLSKAADLLGKQNVIVRVYDRKRLVQGDSTLDFLAACDLPALGNDAEPTEQINPSPYTLTSKLLSDPRIVAGFTGKVHRSPFVRNLRTFFNQERFSRFNEQVLLDEDTRREIMRIFEVGNDYVTENFLTANDADALSFYDDASRSTITDDQLILTYEELVELLVRMQHLMTKEP